MKNLIAFVSFLTLTQAAYAGKSLDVTCGLSRDGAFMTSDTTLQSGMLQTLQCPKFICANAWDIKLNYNGNSYEDVTVTVENTITGEGAGTTAHDVKVGSHIELYMQNKKSRSAFSIDCEVLKAN